MGRKREEGGEVDLKVWEVPLGEAAGPVSRATDAEEAS